MRAKVYFIRNLNPTFNVQQALEVSSATIQPHLLSSGWSDDVLTVATRVLWQSHPRLSPFQWVSRA